MPAITVSAVIITWRRSEISAIAPAGTDSNMIGNAVAAWTNATMSDALTSCVMSHAAQTP